MKKNWLTSNQTMERFQMTSINHVRHLQRELCLGYVVWSFFFLGIPLLLYALVHIVSNLKRSHKLFFWIDNRYREFYDPVENRFHHREEIFTGGWQPTDLQFVRKKTLHITEAGYDGSDGNTIHYRIPVNDKQTICFGNRDDANRFVSMVYEHR